LETENIKNELRSKVVEDAAGIKAGEETGEVFLG
jgi:hypothetical protein